MKLTFVFFLSILMLACSTDDEPAIADASLEGEWVLTNVTCYCAFGEATNFNLTELVFEPDGNKLTVIQNGEHTFFREAGVHYYGGQGDRIGFSDDTVYRFEVNGPLMTLTYQDVPEIADDEVFYSFKRK